MRIFLIAIIFTLHSTSTLIGQTVDGTVTTYDREYLENITSVVNALDLAMKIPGGQVILSRSENNARGFASNDDGILINGKRLSGKNNNSEAALSRIAASQVERIEIIRGSSPDVKISSQQSLMNIVLSSGAFENIGTFDIGTRILPSGRIFPLGLLSYNGTSENLEYFVEISQSGYITDYLRNDTLINGSGVTERLQSDKGDQYFHSRALTGNINYTFSNNDQLRLNARLTEDKSRVNWHGAVKNFDALGALNVSGRSVHNIAMDKPGFEIGGDYTGTLFKNWTYKLLAIYTSEDSKTNQKRDAIITEEPSIFDSDTTFYSNEREAIFRPSLEYTFGNGAEIKLGSEIAYNKVKAGLDPNALITIKEIRSESFFNLTRKLNTKLIADAAINYEYSKISQVRANKDRAEEFSFVKPSLDLRYDLTAHNQVQFSLRRDVSQLDFNDFAASIDEDNIFFGGNQNLRPEKSWEIETSYEHRFANDLGHVKFGLKHDRISDHIEFVEVMPGVAGVGNVGNATRNTASISTSLKFGFIGLENVVFDGNFEYYDTNTIDPFTTTERDFNDDQTFMSTGILRQDFEELGLSYNFQFWYYGPKKTYSIDQLTDRDHDIFYLSFSINYNIFKNMVLTVSVDNLANADESRVRTIYSPQRAGGMVSLIENRDQHYEKRFRLRLKGTF